MSGATIGKPTTNEAAEGRVLRPLDGSRTRSRLWRSAVPRDPLDGARVDLLSRTPDRTMSCACVNTPRLKSSARYIGAGRAGGECSRLNVSLRVDHFDTCNKTTVTNFTHVPVPFESRNVIRSSSVDELSVGFRCTPRWARTTDLRLRRPLLFRLSYGCRPPRSTPNIGVCPLRRRRGRAAWTVDGVEAPPRGTSHVAAPARRRDRAGQVRRGAQAAARGPARAAPLWGGGAAWASTVGW